MAFGAIVQVKPGTTTGSGATSVSATFDSAPTDGNLIAVVQSTRDQDSTVAAPAGFTKLKGYTFTSAADLSLTWWGKIAASDGAGPYTFDGVDHETLTLLEIEGPWPAIGDILDQQADDEGNDVTGSTGTTPETTQADEIAIAAVALRGPHGGWDNTWTNGFTQRSALGSAAGGAASSCSVATKLLSATGTVETTEGWTTSNGYVAGVITLKKGSTAPTDTKSIAGSVTPTGTLVLMPNKALSGDISFASVDRDVTPGVVHEASITPTGTLATEKQTTGTEYTKSMAGTLAPAGALSLTASRSVTVTGSVTPSGTVVNGAALQRSMAGAVTPSGTVLVGRVRDITVTLSGPAQVSWHTAGSAEVGWRANYTAEVD